MGDQQNFAHHDEVLGALMAIGNTRLGEAIRLDRGSALQHLGIGFPALRARVRQGFSFSALPEAQVLAIWDSLWRQSPYGDVLFAALEHYLPQVRKSVPPGLWPVVRHWNERVDNWCHSDLLGRLYARLLEARFDEVHPQLQAWNVSQGVWQRRLSLTSLIHYSGKNVVFLPPEPMLALAAHCVADHRKDVQMALGWLLREAGQAYPDAVAAFLSLHAANMSARAYARAIEKRSSAERAHWLQIRKAGLACA